MPIKSESKYSTRNKKMQLKKSKKDDSSSDEESIGSSDSEMSEDEDYETVSETDSTYTPPKKSRKSSRRRKSYSDTEDEHSDDEDSSNCSDDEEEEDDESVEESCSEDDNESSLDPRELRKTLATLFPSNYINKKVKEDKKQTKREKANEKTKKTKTKNSRRRKVESESEREESESDSDEEDDDANDFNIIFTSLSGSGKERNSKDEAAIKYDPDEELNSDDEQTFMKESYEQVVLPKQILEKKKTEEKKSKNKKSKKSEDDSEPVQATERDIDGEYKDLVELKKDLSEKLKKMPKSKILLTALDDCRTAIKKLVKKTRTKNTKQYYNMVHADEKELNEMDYFKKNLSHKEQVKIMKELKTVNEHMVITKPYRLMLLDSSIPPKHKATVMHKLNMMNSMDPGDSEYYKLKTWVDAFMRIPFNKYQNLSVSIDDGIEKCSEFMENAKKTLDECVYGLDDAKIQIMQMIGQWITNPSALGTAIAIKGPPGTGKTSLTKEGISKILGREFSFIALGGTGDASFLEGHSYTYEGSMWGKIVQILMDSKCMNPVIYFDELDKVSDTPRGEEIIGILTHLTDTSQNNQFHDKYFAEVDFDLSKCMFIFSYNDESKVNPILRDRMYRIETKGYDAKEKMIIAKNFLLPKIREQVRFAEGDVILPDETLDEIIGNKVFTQGEEGVRNLKRCLEIIHTKLNLFRLMKPEHNIFAKDMDMTVTFPIQVVKKTVDKLIKNKETLNQSLLAMYV